MILSIRICLHTTELISITGCTTSLLPWNQAIHDQLISPWQTFQDQAMSWLWDFIGSAHTITTWSTMIFYITSCQIRYVKWSNSNTNAVLAICTWHSPPPLQQHKEKKACCLEQQEKMLVTATWICNHGHKLWTSHTFRKIRVKNCSSKAHLLLALLWETKAAEYMFELCDAERCQLVLQKPHLNNMMNSSWDRVCRMVQIQGSPDKIQLKLLNLQTSLQKQKSSCIHAASFPTHEGRSFFFNNRHTHKATLLQVGPCITHLKPEAISWHSQILRDLRRGLGEGGQRFTWQRVASSSIAVVQELLQWSRLLLRLEFNCFFFITQTLALHIDLSPQLLPSVCASVCLP